MVHFHSKMAQFPFIANYVKLFLFLILICNFHSCSAQEENTSEDTYEDDEAGATNAGTTEVGAIEGRAPDAGATEPGATRARPIAGREPDATGSTEEEATEEEATEEESTEAVTTVPPPPPYPKLTRNTHMCDCINPRRPRGIPILPTYNITDIRTSDPPHPLQDCFDFKLDGCPNSHTKDNLGAVFYQKACPSAPDLRTVEISFVVINEDGFPYGELAVNKFVRECFPVDGVLGVRPVISDMYPISYPCTGYTSSQTKYGRADPKWVNILANLSVPEGGKPAVVQLMLVNLLKATNPFPSKIMMIAEFSILQSETAEPETLRITTGHLENLKFTSVGKMNFAKSSHVIPSGIEVSEEYLDETATSGPITTKAPCKTTPPGKPPAKPDTPKDFVCRCEDWPDTEPTNDSSILPCISPIFNYAGKGNVLAFYLSLEKVETEAFCTNVTLLQIFIVGLSRDGAGSKPDGAFDQVDDAKDFTVGKCLTSPMTPSRNVKHLLRYSRESCSPSTRDYKVLWYYQAIRKTGSILCVKWSISPTAGQHTTEVQAGIKLLYEIDGTKYAFTKMLEPIYEIIVVSQSDYTVNLVSNEKNERAVIQLGPISSTACLHTPQPRASQMCECVSPRRPFYTGRVSAKTEIPDIRTNATLAPCFEFKTAHCSNGGTNENLGVLFVQKECPAVPQLTTSDIAIIAVNENGYPYGKLIVNRYTRACFDPGEEILRYRPVLHFMYPVSYKCVNLFEPERSLYGKNVPEWLSIDANIGVDASVSKAPAVIQATLVNRVKTTAAYPKQLQFIAEFSVKDNPSVPENELRTFRIKTDAYNLAFAANGRVDFQASQNLSYDIVLHSDYIKDEVLQIPYNPVCSGKPQPLPPPPPPPNPSWSMCRCIEWDTNSTNSVLIAKCIAVVFVNNPPNSLFFYASVQKLDKDPVCQHLVIEELLFQILGRGSTGLEGTKAYGVWSKVNAEKDYEIGKCVEIPKTPEEPPPPGAPEPTKPKPAKTGKFYKQSCSTSTNDNKMYYFYKELAEDGDIICGKWTLAIPPQEPIEMQFVYKIQFYDKRQGKGAKLRYFKRHPNIYELIPEGNNHYHLEVVANTTNPRVDMLLPRDPIPNAGSCIVTPFIPTSVVCSCLRFRHSGFHQSPLKSPTINISSLTTNPFPKECFNFTILPCSTDGKVYDTIGGLLIIHSSKDKEPCNQDFTVADVAFQGLQEDGFPFGEPLYNNFLRTCIPPDQMLDYHVRGRDFANPVEGHCTGKVDADEKPFAPKDFKYPTIPTWLEVNVDAHPTKMTKPLAIQIYLKRVTAKAKQIQLVAEMVINRTGVAHIYSLRTPVYSLAYSNGGYNPSEITPAKDAEGNPVQDILQNSEYYEIDKRLAACPSERVLSVPEPEGEPFHLQHCGECFEYFDKDNVHKAARLSHTSKLYSHFSACVEYFTEAKMSSKKPQALTFFISVIANDSSLPDCKGYQVIGAVLTPLKQKYAPAAGFGNANSVYGFPHGEFQRATFAPPPVETWGIDCPLPEDYKAKGGKLRRSSWDYQVICGRQGRHDLVYTRGWKMMYFTYPLMNQTDNANGFCAPWSIPEEEKGASPERFEFQIVGEFFIESHSKPVKYYYALKRTQVFEYLPDPPAPTATITFPGKIFPVADASADLHECDTNICIF